MRQDPPYIDLRRKAVPKREAPRRRYPPELVLGLGSVAGLGTQGARALMAWHEAGGRKEDTEGLEIPLRALLKSASLGANLLQIPVKIRFILLVECSVNYGKLLSMSGDRFGDKGRDKGRDRPGGASSADNIFGTLSGNALDGLTQRDLDVLGGTPSQILKTLASCCGIAAEDVLRLVTFYETEGRVPDSLEEIWLGKSR